MAKKYFGTDGIRGKVNLGAMTPEMAMKIGMATGQYFLRGNHKNKVIIGKDTRLSGYMIEPALVAGIVAGGMDVVNVGPIPTPGLAMLTKSMRADLGIMISASHNPFYDNGLKFFGPDGYKLSDKAELEIESRLTLGQENFLVKPEFTGRVKRLDDVRGRYIEFAKNTVAQKLNLGGLKVVVDCANGAAYQVAPQVLWELGADVVPVGVTPDGFNINSSCGSTHPEYIAEQVVTHGADIGIALDGDADRLILVDECGKVIDGDQIMGVIATSWVEQNILKGGGLVSTIMSNLGLERFIQSKGLSFIRTRVGDRYVVEHMRKNNFNLGGEQSGHVVMTDYATTGDGILASLQVLQVLVKSNKPASEALRLFAPIPQVMRSVSYQDIDPLENSVVKTAILDGKSLLGNTGRLVIRKSGTEPLIRVMVEGEDDKLVEKVVSQICQSVKDSA
ncbi:MAG: phosphoglucosamine mutase [Sphingomonadales bacterium]